MSTGHDDPVTEWTPAEGGGPWFGLWHGEDEAFIAFDTDHSRLQELVDGYGDHLEVRRLSWVAYDAGEWGDPPNRDGDNQ